MYKQVFMNSNLIKTINYIKRNGLINAAYAIKERLNEDRASDYKYVPIEEAERLAQIEKSKNMQATFSILVPTYETKPEYLRELIDSVLNQTYKKFEIVIADGSVSSIVADEIKRYEDDRIRYVKLDENGGISRNSNEGLKHCSMEYTALLDHDDILTEDALYNMASLIDNNKRNGIELQLLYSDEDKTNSENTAFFDPNIKPEFNLDLLLSNNYICHFLVVKSEIIKELGFRPEFDGAQDHDLILRVVGSLQNKNNNSYHKLIAHANKVLYHWRCHEGSTSLNPQSKSYAYTAGKRAIESYLSERGIKGKVIEQPHVGFFYIEYEDGIFNQRNDVCAVVGRVLDKKNKVKDGPLDNDGNVMFKGLDKHNSGGKLHRASCQMEVPYISVIGMKANKEAENVFNKLLNEELTSKGEDIDYKELSMRFCDLMKIKGYKFVYDPKLIIKGK